MTNKYPWEAAYMAAITETDHQRLPSLIQNVRAELDERIKEFVLDNRPEEREAISKALYALRLLWIERCEGEDPSNK